MIVIVFFRMMTALVVIYSIIQRQLPCTAQKAGNSEGMTLLSVQILIFKIFLFLKSLVCYIDFEWRARVLSRSNHCSGIKYSATRMQRGSWAAKEHFEDISCGRILLFHSSRNFISSYSNNKFILEASVQKLLKMLGQCQDTITQTCGYDFNNSHHQLLGSIFFAHNSCADLHGLEDCVFPKPCWSPIENVCVIK